MSIDQYEDDLRHIVGGAVKQVFERYPLVHPMQATWSVLATAFSMLTTADAKSARFILEHIEGYGQTPELTEAMTSIVRGYEQKVSSVEAEDARLH